MKESVIEKGENIITAAIAETEADEIGLNKLSLLLAHSVNNR
jgi:hypothetical protein